VNLWTWAAVVFAAFFAAYLLLVLALVLSGRKTDARAWAGFIPDCVVLVTRLARDPRVARRHRWLLGILVAYLALPFDLIPDFIPVAGVMDDAIIVAVVLRRVIRGAGPAVVREHWSGPDSSLHAILRLTGLPATVTR
jgi:uncharacterized membrane protein YkvA (DUF1232 family)